jgi:GntR family transcriptional regulator
MRNTQARSSPATAARTAMDSLPLPKYHQIYLVLRQKLDEGLYDDGVPPEKDLAQQFGVGRVTVRRALEQLVIEGLIIREAGRGTWPAPRTEQQDAAAQGDNVNLRLGGLLNNIVQASRRTSIKVLEWSVIRASPVLAQALQVAEGADVRKIVRTRSSNAGPVSFITTYLPVERAAGFTRADVARKPVLQLLEESGVEWGRARQTISASQADATVAAELDVSIGAALLSVRRLVYDSNDQPVQLLHGLYRPDRYEYQMELTQFGDIAARVAEGEILP